MDFGFTHHAASSSTAGPAHSMYVSGKSWYVLVYVRGGDSGSRKVPRKTIDSARFVHFRYFVFSCDESCPVSFSSIFFSLVWHVFHYLIIVFQCFFLPCFHHFPSLYLVAFCGRSHAYATKINQLFFHGVYGGKAVYRNNIFSI